MPPSTLTSAQPNNRSNELLASARGFKLGGGIVIGIGAAAAATSITFAVLHSQCSPDNDCRSATSAYSVMTGIGALVALPIGVALYLHGRSLSREADRASVSISLLSIDHGAGLVARGAF